LAEIAAIVEAAFTVTWPVVPAPEPLPDVPLELPDPAVELAADEDEPPPPPQPETPIKIDAPIISVLADRVPKFRVSKFNAESCWGKSWGVFPAANAE
jgi:hypothetical protein